MKQYNKISDEELAAYLEGMLCGKDATRVESAMDVDTLEVLSVAGKALEKFSADNVIALPSWNDVAATQAIPTFRPMAMAGFLGDSNADDTFEDDSEDDNR